jgi:Fe-S cluster assembly iron-binding protein IscA
LRQIAVDQKLGTQWWVRLDVVWKPDAQIEVNLDRKPPGPNDFVVEADGFRCVMSEEQKVYLKGSRVELFWTNEGAGFNVSFPNRDTNDKVAAAEWIKGENAKRKSAEKPK